MTRFNDNEFSRVRGSVKGGCNSKLWSVSFSEREDVNMIFFVLGDYKTFTQEGNGRNYSVILFFEMLKLMKVQRNFGPR